jgi:subtilisin family serine protease
VIGASSGFAGLLAGARRGLALGVVLALAPTLVPLSAQAQLRGLTGSVGGVGGAVGGIGSSLPGSAPVGTNVGPSLPAADPTLPSVPRPDLSQPALTRPVDTVTNTLSGSVGNTLAVPSRATGQLGNAANRGAARAPSGVPPVGERRFVPDEVMIRLPGNMSPQAVDELARRHGLTRLESQSVGLTGTTFHRLRISDRRAVAGVIAALEAEGAIAAAQPSYRFTLAQTGAGASGVAQYALAKLNVPAAHRLATGEKVLVAVIDSGIDTAHPEIEGLVAQSFDPLSSGEPPHGHGTAMAGAIIAHDRLTGISPAAHILAIRAFDASGAATEGTTLTLLRSIDWAVARGARVINMSFAGPSDPEIARALAAARKKGVVLVAAAGNAGAKSPPLFPASDPNVIAVTALDDNDKLLPVANRGKHIAVAAPGVDVLAAAPGGGYQMTSGTSIAAAHVSGIAALIIARRPHITPDALRKVLMSTATDLGPKGRDDQFGAGLANAYRAVQSLDMPAPAAQSASAAR